MRAVICDACKKVYKPYFMLDGYGEGNMLTVVKTEKDGKMHGKMRLELCPECMVKAHEFIANELIQPESPADLKYFQDAPDTGESEE